MSTYVSRPMGNRLGIYADDVELIRRSKGLDEKGFKLGVAPNYTTSLTDHFENNLVSRNNPPNFDLVDLGDGEFDNLDLVGLFESELSADADTDLPP